MNKITKVVRAALAFPTEDGGRDIVEEEIITTEEVSGRDSEGDSGSENKLDKIIEGIEKLDAFESRFDGFEREIDNIKKGMENIKNEKSITLSPSMNMKPIDPIVSRWYDATQDCKLLDEIDVQVEFNEEPAFKPLPETDIEDYHMEKASTIIGTGSSSSIYSPDIKRERRIKADVLTLAYSLEDAFDNGDSQSVQILTKSLIGVLEEFVDSFITGNQKRKENKAVYEKQYSEIQDNIKVMSKTIIDQQPQTNEEVKEIIDIPKIGTFTDKDLLSLRERALGEITTYVKSKSGKISKGGNALDFSVCSGKWSTIRKMNGLNKEDGAIFWDWIKPECRKVFESEYSPPTEKESMDDVTSIDSMESNESESSIEDIEVIDDTNDDKTD